MCTDVVLVERAQIGVECDRVRATPAASACAWRAARSRPPISSTSSMLSRLCESEPRQPTPAAGDPAAAAEARERRSGPRAVRPVAVALDGVDLAVVREQAIRVRQSPLRQRVGGEALVEHGDRSSRGADRRGPGRTAPGTAASPCPCRRWCWPKDSARRTTGPPRRLFGAAPRHEQPAIECRLVEILRRRSVDEYLFDARQHLQRLGAAGLRGRAAPRASRPPADPARRALRRARARAASACVRRARQEHQARGERCAKRDARLGRQRAQEPSGFFRSSTAAVAGLAVGGNRAAVREAIERADGGLHQPVTGEVVEAGDQPEAATVALVRLFIESRGSMHGEEPRKKRAVSDMRARTAGCDLRA